MADSFIFKEPRTLAIHKEIEQQERLQKSLALQRQIEKITGRSDLRNKIIEDRQRLAKQLKDAAIGAHGWEAALNRTRDISRIRMTAFDEISAADSIRMTAFGEIRATDKIRMTAFGEISAADSIRTTAFDGISAADSIRMTAFGEIRATDKIRMTAFGEISAADSIRTTAFDGISAADIISARNRATAFAGTSATDRIQVWSKAVELQNSITLSIRTRQAIQGINFSDEFLQSVQSSENSTKPDEIISSLEQDSIYLGENQEGQIILPEDIKESFEAVNFIPVKIFHKILNDPSLMRTISSRNFEYFIAEILEKIGFSNVDVTPESGDGGRDITATLEVGDIPMLYAFECKKYAERQKIGPAIMRALLGTITHDKTKANIGVLVTTSSFTKGSRDIIKSNPLIDGKDFNGIGSWINQANAK